MRQETYVARCGGGRWRIGSVKQEAGGDGEGWRERDWDEQRHSRLGLSSGSRTESKVTHEQEREKKGPRLLAFDEARRDGICTIEPDRTSTLRR